MTHVLEMNAKLDTLKAVEADIDGLKRHAPNNVNGTGTSFRDEVLDEVLVLLADRKKKVV